MELNVENPVVLLMGKTGAGKSTLGNLLTGAPHDSGPFTTSSRMDSVTQECSAATMLIDGVSYNIVDAPGIYDTQEGTEPVLKKIAKTVNKCAHGVKAIIIVLDVVRYTEEQKNALNEIRMFLGKDATNNIITVFSRATRAQTDDRNVMQRDWNQSIRSFIQGIGNRWGISPNPDIFSPDAETFKVRLREIKDLINSIQGVYTTEQLEKNLQELAEAERRKKEDEERAKRQQEEKLKEDARRNAEEAHQNEIKRIQQEADRKLREAMEELRRKEKEISLFGGRIKIRI